MFIASMTPIHRLSGPSDVTGAPLTSCHDKTKRRSTAKILTGVHARPHLATGRSGLDNVFPVPAATRFVGQLHLSEQKSSTTKRTES